LSVGLVNKNLKTITLRGHLFWRLVDRLTANTLAIVSGFNLKSKKALIYYEFKLN